MIDNESRIDALHAVATKYGYPLAAPDQPARSAAALTSELADGFELPTRRTSLELVAHAAQVRGHLELAGPLSDLEQVHSALSWIRFSTIASFISGARTYRHLDHLVLAALYDALEMHAEADGQLHAAATAARTVGEPVTWDGFVDLPYGSDERNDAVLDLAGSWTYIDNVLEQLAPDPEPEPDAAQPNEPVGPSPQQQQRMQVEQHIHRIHTRPRDTVPAKMVTELLDTITSDSDERWRVTALGHLGSALSQNPANWRSTFQTYTVREQLARGVDSSARVHAFMQKALLLRTPGLHQNLRESFSIAAEGHQVAQSLSEFTPRAQSAVTLALLYLDANQPDKAVALLNEVTAMFPESSIATHDLELCAQLWAVFSRSWADMSKLTGDRSYMDRSTQALQHSRSLFDRLGLPNGFDHARQSLHF